MTDEVQDAFDGMQPRIRDAVTARATAPAPVYRIESSPSPIRDTYFAAAEFERDPPKTYAEFRERYLGDACAPPSRRSQR